MRSIQIYDTTLRDGAQGEGVSFSLEDKLQITRRLDEIGVDYVENEPLKVWGVIQFNNHLPPEYLLSRIPSILRFCTKR